MAGARQRRKGKRALATTTRIAEKAKRRTQLENVIPETAARREAENPDLVSDLVGTGAAAAAGGGGSLIPKALKSSKALKVAGGVSGALLLMTLLDALYGGTIGRRSGERDARFRAELEGDALGRMNTEETDLLEEMSLDRAVHAGASAREGAESVLGGQQEGLLTELILGREEALKGLSVRDRPSAFEILGGRA